MESDGITRIYWALGDPLDVEHEYFPVDRGPMGSSLHRHNLDPGEIAEVIRNNDCWAKLVSRERWQVRPEGRLRTDTFNEDGTLNFSGGHVHIDLPLTGSFFVDRPASLAYRPQEEAQHLATEIEKALGRSGLTIILT